MKRNKTKLILSNTVNQIGDIDRKIIRLLLERLVLITKVEDLETIEVNNDIRLEIIIANARNLAVEEGVNPDTAEIIFRSISDCFTKKDGTKCRLMH